jgi:RNA polymerase sigma factor (sigma-70 family)
MFLHHVQMRVQYRFSGVSHADIEDAVMDAVEKLLRTFGVGIDFEHPDYCAWLVTATIRGLIDKHRHDLHIIHEENCDQFCCCGVANEFEDQYDTQYMLQKLPPRLQNIVQLRIEGYSIEEIGQRIGRTPESIYKVIQRSRVAFLRNTNR